ncbi:MULTISPECIES: hypothetical protein [Ponticoccus]|uniref:DUF1127 domain-containing protein n=1 Tax=Ponticoccus litoralis TaxID=422297 RepID=A0AAW9SIL1_9RHOB
MPRDNVQIGMGHASIHQKIDRYFLEIGLGLNPYALRRGRLREIIVLESATDAQLAELGLRREEILSFVFRDILAV